MLLCEWKPFSTDLQTYNSKEEFEELIGDRFEAMMFDEKEELPSYIWTENFVCIIKKSTRMISDISITKIPREPVSSISE
ncbi:MAG: hypothetical protein ACI35P_02730 [Bacillus sp. (in: firmicutes)]